MAPVIIHEDIFNCYSCHQHLKTMELDYTMVRNTKIFGFWPRKEYLNSVYVNCMREYVRSGWLTHPWGQTRRDQDFFGLLRSGGSDGHTCIICMNGLKLVGMGLYEYNYMHRIRKVLWLWKRKEQLTNVCEMN